MFIMCDIKCEKSNKLTLKIELIAFTTTLSISKVLMKTDKESYKNIGIYNTGYIIKKKIDDCKSIDSVNPLYLLIDHASGYVKDLNSLYLNIDHASGYFKEKDINRYLVYDSADEKKRITEKIW